MVHQKRQQQQEQGIKPWQAQLAVLLLLVATSLPHAAAIRPRNLPSRHLLVLEQHGARADSVAYVATASADKGIKRPTVTLLEALQDPQVTHMILLTNYTVGEHLQQALHAHPTSNSNMQQGISGTLACFCQHSSHKPPHAHKYYHQLCRDAVAVHHVLAQAVQLVCAQLQHISALSPYSVHTSTQPLKDGSLPTHHTPTQHLPPILHAKLTACPVSCGCTPHALTTASLLLLCWCVAVGKEFERYAEGDSAPLQLSR